MDRRQIRTRDAIFKAFSSLLVEKAFNRITVQEIIDEADVGRATFYSHFETKDSLLTEMCDAVFGRIMDNAASSLNISSDSTEPFDGKNVFLKIIKSLQKDNSNIIDLISGCNGELVCIYFRNHLQSFFALYLSGKYKENISEYDKYFFVNHLSSTFMEAVGWWISTGMKESPEKAGDKFVQAAKSVLVANDFLIAGVGMVSSELEFRSQVNMCSDEVKNYLNVLEVMSQCTDDFLYVMDGAREIIYVFSPEASQFSLLASGEEVIKISDFLNAVHESERNRLDSDIKALFDGKKNSHDMDLRLKNNSGKYVWVNIRGKAVRDKDGNFSVIMGRVSEEALRHLSNPLTGLFNKLKMMSDFKENFASMNEGYLMLIDIDDLAAINLSRGREYGDEILTELASVLEKHSLVKSVYHVDHNYFAACLNTKTAEEARSFYIQLRYAMLGKCTLTAGVVPIDSSLFIDENDMYDSVKITLRKAKNKGKNSLKFFSTDEIKRSVRSVELLEELNESSKKDFEGFSVLYQPQISGGNYEIVSVEALMRYRSAKFGPVYPDEFIPILEQSGLIKYAGMWILEKALEQCREWRKFIPALRVSVNFSVVQFKDEDIVEKILNILGKTHMPGSALTVEITESVPFSDTEYFTNVIANLKREGIQIAIDDFGSGYSNIGYLKKLDVDEIKIDRMFVMGIQEGTYNFKVIQNTIEFAKNNSLRVCCEGVEQKEELAVLEILSPEILQGYMFDKPCTVGEIESKYIDKNSDGYKSRVAFVDELYRYNEKLGIIRFDPTDILRQTNVGLWVIRINPKNGHCEMHADETMERIMGVDKKYTPADCYNFWHNRVHKDYVEYVQKNVRVMTELKKVVQLQYPWNHPEYGEVIVRCSGKRVADSDGMIMLEGYHRILSNIEEV